MRDYLTRKPDGKIDKDFEQDLTIFLKRVSVLKNVVNKRRNTPYNSKLMYDITEAGEILQGVRKMIVKHFNSLENKYL